MTYRAYEAVKLNSLPYAIKFLSHIVISAKVVYGTTKEEAIRCLDVCMPEGKENVLELRRNMLAAIDSIFEGE